MLVFQNPFFATVGADGKYRIEGVPPGTYTLKAWNERKKTRPQKVQVKPDETVRREIELR